MIKMILRATNRAKWAITMVMALFSMAINAQDNETLARSYYLQAEDAYSNGDNKTALENLDKTVEHLGSTNAKVEALFVRTFQAKGDLYKAKDHLNTYFELADSSDGDYNDMVRMVATLKDKIEAMQKKEGYKGNLINGKKEGKWEYYWSNGDVQQTVTYKNDKPISDFKIFYGKQEYYYWHEDKDWEETRDKGKFAYYRVIKYENGTWVNPVRDYYANGTLEMEAYYQNEEAAHVPKLEGLLSNKPVKFYSENGKLAYSCHYVNDKKEGEYKFYYKNGELATSGFYVDGKMEGEFKFHWDNGDLRNTLTYKNDEPASDYRLFFDKDWTTTHKRDEFTYYRVVKYENGKWTNLVRDYYANDTLRREAYYKSEKLPRNILGNNVKNKVINNTAVKWFYKNGKLEKIGHFLNGTKHGEEKTYYENGQLKWEGEYYFGGLYGITNWYHSNGQLLRAIEFKIGHGHAAVFFKSIAAFDKEGNQLKKGTLKNGRGTLHLYDENGNLEKSIKFKDGLPIE